MQEELCQSFALFSVSVLQPVGSITAEDYTDPAYGFIPGPVGEDNLPPPIKIDRDTGQYVAMEVITSIVVMEVHDGCIVAEMSPQWDGIFRRNPVLLPSIVEGLRKMDNPPPWVDQSLDGSAVAAEQSFPGIEDLGLPGIDDLASEFHQLLESMKPEWSTTTDDGPKEATLEAVSEEEISRVIESLESTAEQAGSKDVLVEYLGCVTLSAVPEREE